MEEKEIKKGDLVRHITGGPIMVLGINDPCIGYSCSYWDSERYEFRTVYLRLSDLKIADETKNLSDKELLVKLHNPK